ncbi:hypothetical protein sS8_3011 [Methylocaldum marinum]|uniref:Uncharacterized protein n=1 Tax=Methylocaldum marinum TaxID=1432792 RepID=A0A250KTX1_9GAMM|nr:hypothetical protein sS8_3011 [Methylocaldum marinum]
MRAPIQVVRNSSSFRIVRDVRLSRAGALKEALNKLIPFMPFDRPVEGLNQNFLNAPVWQYEAFDLTCKRNSA